jgi:extradiol dioxygenase
MSVSQLGYLGLFVRDLDAWVRFATELMGMQAWDERGDDGTVYLRMDERHHRLMLTPAKSDAVRCTGWEVADQHAVGRVSEKLAARGIRVVAGTEEEKSARQVLHLARFEDPSGLQGELYAGPYVDTRPFSPGRPIAGFATGVLGMGHVVVGVDRAAPLEDLYRDALGFRVSDYIDLRDRKLVTTFMHCNPRHHSVAFVEGPGVVHGALNHFMVEVLSLDDVGRALDVAGRLGLNVTQGLGRHSNDLATSFYVMSPSGFRVEYAWSPIQIPDGAPWSVQHYTSTSIWGHKPPHPQGSGR